MRNADNKKKTKSMPKTSDIKTFVTETTKAKAKAIAKLRIKLTEKEALSKEVSALFAQVEKAGIAYKSVKGVLTLH
jgi:hypothetical protein